MNGFCNTVAMMTDADLCALSGDLRRRYSENDVSGEMLGIVLVEQAERFAKQVRKARGLEVPATPNKGEGFL